MILAWKQSHSESIKDIVWNILPTASVNICSRKIILTLRIKRKWIKKYCLDWKSWLYQLTASPTILFISIWKIHGHALTCTYIVCKKNNSLRLDCNLSELKPSYRPLFNVFQSYRLFTLVPLMMPIFCTKMCIKASYRITIEKQQHLRFS